LLLVIYLVFAAVPVYTHSQDFSVYIIYIKTVMLTHEIVGKSVEMQLTLYITFLQHFDIDTAGWIT